MISITSGELIIHEEDFRFGGCGYDHYGNQVSIQQPNRAKTQFVYKNNRLVLAKNPLGALWEYDESGKITTQIGADNDITRYEYQDDLLVKLIDSQGQDTL